MKTKIVSLIALMLCSFSAPQAKAANPANILVVPTIAALKGISASAAAQYPSATVWDYYGTGTGCPISYTWVPTDSRADNGGAIINPASNAGNGRWDLNQSPTSPVHSCVFGVKVDSPAQTGTGTDNTTQVQALINWAFQYGPNHIWLDSSNNNCIKIASHLTPAQGQIMEGDGAGDPNQVTNAGATPANTGSCLNYTGIPGAGGEYAIQLQTPCSGLGTTEYASPQFKNFSINYFSTDTNPGGGIQLNTIACGFTDDTTSQQALSNPKFENMRCSLRNIANSQKICIQVSKARETIIDGVTSFGGLTAFNLEGNENAIIRSCASSFTYGSEIVLRTHGTFGNNTTVQNCQLLSLGVWGQTVDSLLLDNERSSLIQNNLFENLLGTALTSQIHLGSSVLSAGIYSNAITAVAASNWLLVDGLSNNIVAHGNSGYGVNPGAAKFSTGNYLYNSSLRSVLVHYGNGGGDDGWPFNSSNGLDEVLSPKVETIYSPNFPGLLSGGYGLSEIPVNSTFTMPVTGNATTNELLFGLNRIPTPTGAFDLSIHAWQTTGAGEITCQFLDNNVLVGSSHAFTLTAVPQWITWLANQTISTSLGVDCWNTGTGTAPNPAMFNLLEVNDH